MITITENAASKVAELMANEGTQNASLRVYISGGGCSGFNYGMAFDDATDEEDQVFEQHGVKVLVDSYSAPYLGGAEIDYVDGLMGSGFTIHNPNAVSTCSCGHSFQTADHAGTARSCH